MAQTGLTLIAAAPAVPDVTALEQRLADVEQVAQAGVDKGDNAREMVLRRDDKLNAAVADAASAVEQYDTLAELAASYAQALPASVADRKALHEGLSALAQQVAAIQAMPTPRDGQDGRDGASAYDLARAAGYGGTQAQWLASLRGADGQSIKGDTGPAGTANLALGARSIAALALLGSVTVTLPLSRTMPNTSYSHAFAHTGVVDLTKVTYSDIVKTTTSITVKVTASGLALVAGQLLVAVW